MQSDNPTTPSAAIRHVRRFVALAGIVIVALTISVAALIWAGPLISGALFLSRPTGKTPVSHDLPDSYELRHKGYIDDATGLYVREDEDLVLRHTPPFVLTRTYLSGDRVSRQFGIGATDNAEWYLIGDPSDFSWAELILADGGRRILAGGFHLNNKMSFPGKAPTRKKRWTITGVERISASHG